jgi:hypothetical protein
MYLGYIAGWCGLPTESKLLFSVTDAIRSIRLSDAGQQELYSMVRSVDRAALDMVITLLVDTYKKELFTAQIDSDSSEDWKEFLPHVL